MNSSVAQSLAASGASHNAASGMGHRLREPSFPVSIQAPARCRNGPAPSRCRTYHYTLQIHARHRVFLSLDYLIIGLFNIGLSSTFRSVIYRYQWRVPGNFAHPHLFFSAWKEVLKCKLHRMHCTGPRLYFPTDENHNLGYSHPEETRARTCDNSNQTCYPLRPARRERPLDEIRTLPQDTLF